MANPSNRSASVDFAPAWLKLPEQPQEQKRPDCGRQFTSKNSHSFQSQPHYNSYNNSTAHRNSHPQVRHQNAGSSTALRNGRGAKPHIRPVHIEARSPPQLVEPRTPAPPTKSTPTVDEEFPCLRSGVGQPNAAQANSQWRIKQSSQRPQDESSQKPPHDKLITSNMTGEVYRAQVKPVRRSNTIPITNGAVPLGAPSQENGDASVLSSSVEKEKRLLHEMGWIEDDDQSGDDCEIPRDPAQLQEIFNQAKAARERLLTKSKMQVKGVPARLPVDADLPSSSENSDVD